MLNRIILIGRLTRDPELRFTPNGRAVCSFTLAVDRSYASQDGTRETDFINIVVWGKQAENTAQYLAKGRLTAVEGRLQIRSYEDNNGQRRTAAEVVADNVRFLPTGGRDGGQTGGYGQGNFGAAPAAPAFGGSFGEPAADDMPMTSDDLPF